MGNVYELFFLPTGVRNEGSKIVFLSIRRRSDSSFMILIEKVSEIFPRQSEQ